MFGCTINLHVLTCLLQRSDLLDVHVNKFMLSTIISTLYVLHKTIITVILKKIWLYNNLYRIIPLIP